MIYLLDLFGVAVFAISGALTVGRKGMDLFGVMAVAVVAAVGGGTLLDRPIFWISDPTHLFAILAAVAAILSTPVSSSLRPAPCSSPTPSASRSLP